MQHTLVLAPGMRNEWEKVSVQSACWRSIRFSGLSGLGRGKEK